MTGTVGVDLAAEPRGTAVARVEWSDRAARVTHLRCPADDETVLTTTTASDHVGIDCPLGWPDPFVDFVSRHRRGTIGVEDGMAEHWRRRLTNRSTDLACIDYTRVHADRAVRPLSVSADLLGHTALRASVLLAGFERAGFVVDRSGGSGSLAEIYPAACLALWRVGPRNYKGTNRHRLGEVVDNLSSAAPWLDLGEHDEQIRASDHCFDAVVTALGARAVQIARSTEPTDDQLALARREGWIRLPSCALEDLIG